MSRNAPWILLNAALALVSTNARAADLRDLRVLEDDAGTRAVLELEGSTPYRLFNLQNPERLVLDLPGTRLAADYRNAAANGLIANVRTGQPTPGTLRVVFDLGKPVLSSGRWESEGGRTRLIVELKSLAGGPPETGSLAVAVAAMALPSVPSVEPQMVPVAEPLLPSASNVQAPPPIVEASGAPTKTIQDILGLGERELVVAIDAGHGGKDPGAHGPSGVNEKNVTLAVARELAKKIDADPGMKAVLIRDNDSFVPLQDRFMKARAAQSDLFISIHADASPNGSASGASVYVLSTRGASSQAARWLADKENAADLVGGVSLDEKDPGLAAVLLDLSQSATMRASDGVADQVLAALKKVGKAHKPAIERANFVVLRSPDVPSMLIETGFITNPSEEKKLNDAGYRDRLASAIAEGVRQYFTTLAPAGTLYAARSEQKNPVGECVVGRGETLSSIAARHSVPVAALRQANNKRNDRVRVGERLAIPLSVASAPE